ncbi:MAG: beta-lactamase family protein [Clostridia bacterium]|nr:beta-lactamase family protein [Clostridia bacterium]
MFDPKILSQKLAAIQKDRNIAGMTVAVTDSKGIIYNEAFGVDNMERPEVKAGTDSVFRIASVTKMFTGTLIMQLCEQGKVELDAPVKKYLPWLKLRKSKATETLTVRHLLTHTGGFFGDGAWTSKEGTRDEDGIENTLRTILPWVELKAMPEDKVHIYSNIGYALLGQIAASVTGGSYSQAVQDNILTPLGMNKATFDFYIAATYPYSCPHLRGENGELTVLHDLRRGSLYTASGGLYSDSADLCKMARMFLRGGIADSGERVLGEDTLKLMQGKHMPRDNGDFYGFATVVHPLGYREIYGHGGSNLPYNTGVYYDYRSGLGVVVLMNTEAADLRVAIPEMIFEM